MIFGAVKTLNITALLVCRALPAASRDASASPRMACTGGQALLAESRVAFDYIFPVMLYVSILLPILRAVVANVAILHGGSAAKPAAVTAVGGTIDTMDITTPMVVGTVLALLLQMGYRYYTIFYQS